MNKNKVLEREHWGGHIGFILAATGSAVGLGNIWKFPYIAGMNGGGAFVLIYLLCIAIIGLPIIICEITIGRRTQKNPYSAFRELAPSATNGTRAVGLLFLLMSLGMLCFSKFGLAAIFLLVSLAAFYTGWAFIGLMCVFTPFIILSYYGVVGGWTCGYFLKGLMGGLNFETAEEAGEVFQAFAGSAWTAVSFQLIFMLLTGAIVWFGIRNGIELASKILLPLLFLLLLTLVMRSLTLPGAEEGVRFLLSPDFSQLTPEGVLIALGHAFFSLSLGMGALITYGSYMDRTRNIFTAGFSIVFLDTLISLIAGLAIFPAVFAMGMGPDVGPGLIFQIMPLTFTMMGESLAWIWVSMFFLLLVIAALTSAISMLEVIVAFLIDEFKWNRKTAVVVTLAIAAFAGAMCSISVFDWHAFPWLERIFVFAFGGTKGNLFDVFDSFSSNYLLPLGGLGIALFVGWIWGTRYAVEEIRKGGQQYIDVNFFSLLAGLKDDPISQSRAHTLTLGTCWGIFIRFITPIAIIIAFLHSIGWLSLG
ncbi:MAG: sodium-dependent transporter [Planctomycetia bacterium]|nr:sodium-dependent transporter [Planctomycetia bacterium]